MDKYFISDPEMTNSIISKFGNSGGVYMLKCDDGNGQPISINRMLEKDKEGVLYIGKADNFSDRVATLKKSIAPIYKSDTHECGVRYKNNDRISDAFPFEQLYLTLIPSEEPRSVELVEITSYEKNHGELPPLNRSA